MDELDDNLYIQKKDILKLSSTHAEHSMAHLLVQ